MPDGKRFSRARAVYALIGVATLAATLAATDRGRSATDPLPECVEYATVVSKCFGEDRARAITAAPPPTDSSARSALARRCAADRVRLDRACR